MSRDRFRPAFALAAALPLAACLSFGAKPPPTLMSLTPEASVPVGTARNFTDGNALFVLVPSVPQALATPRVAVQVSATDIAYLPKAQWVDTPNKLFRNLLAETIEARTTRVVAEPRDATVAPDMRLGGRLLSFGLDAQAHAVVVTYDASLVRNQQAPVETRRFEARAPVSNEQGPAVGAALNRAANQVAGEVARWIG